MLRGEAQGLSNPYFRRYLADDRPRPGEPRMSGQDSARLGPSAFSAVTVLAAPAAAGAQDETYIFDVAVNVSNLAPEVQAIGVAVAYAMPINAIREREMQSEAKTRTISCGRNRHFTGTISVEVKKPSETARLYLHPSLAPRL
jgi:hypothetical protein